MKSSWLVPLGLVLVLVGLVWAGQGLNWIKGSGMSGVTLWAIVGPVVAVLGVVVAGIGLQRRER
ncbi:MAG: hypothetical protein JWP74_954 [Marmoricola sp.]|nr:hypothetical protein [Marmoricola sp.]